MSFLVLDLGSCLSTDGRAMCFSSRRRRADMDDLSHVRDTITAARLTPLRMYRSG